METHRASLTLFSTMDRTATLTMRPARPSGETTTPQEKTMLTSHSPLSPASHLPQGETPLQKQENFSRHTRRLCRRTTLVFTLVALSAWNLMTVHALTTKLRFNDFGRFYYSASAFMRGQDMYRFRPPEALQETESLEWQCGRVIICSGNLNPPHFHFLLIPLVFFSPLNALALWGIAGVLSLITSLRLIIKETALELTPRLCWGGGLSLLGFVGTGTMLASGQLSFLLMLPVTLAWIAARQGRWTRASVHLGLAMSVKPFLLLFLPYFLYRRQIRALGAATITGVLCLAAGVLVFGMDAHRGWLQTLSVIQYIEGSWNASIVGFLCEIWSGVPSPSLLFQAPATLKRLWFILAGVVGLCTFVTVWWDSTKEKEAVDRHFALLLLTALLISPLSWPYYWWLPLGPFVALAVTWQRSSQWKLFPFTPVCWRNCFLLLAVPGLFWPFLAVDLFPSHLWARASVGSIYFWTTFFLWASLIADWCMEVTADTHDR